MNAALDVFAERGFAAARMEDVAARAGVAKGTTYLYFPSKEALFEGILAAVIGPVVEGLVTLQPEPGEASRAFAERLILAFDARIRAGRGGDVLRLLVAEGPRFPQLAAIYHRVVVSVGLGAVRALAARAEAAGEADPTLGRFPQLLVAPVLLGILWDGLFGHLEPLDHVGLVRSQLDLVFATGTGRPA